MNILVIQPGFPAEIPYFVRGLAAAGATVLGVGDQPAAALPEPAAESLDAYLHVRQLWDADAVIQALRDWDVPVRLDRVECLWEPGMGLAATLRKAFGLPGLTEEETVLFRDKEMMKRALDKAGVRTPRHQSAKTEEECRQAAAKIGYPLIIKPISGAGSADTYHIKDQEGFEEVLPKLRGVREVAIEEFIRGKEYTFDTICVDGQIHYYNVAWYRPNVLIARSEEWISPQTVTLNDFSDPGLQKGIALGKKVLKALNFKTGFTHMEWFLTPEGEAIFGEIGARPPGGRSVELMNYGCDIDVFRGWADAVAHGRLSFETERKYNAAVIFKRAHGHGRIERIMGLEEIQQKFGRWITCVNLSPIGAPRRDWKQTLVSDGYLILRHPDLEETCRMADYVAKNLQIYAA